MAVAFAANLGVVAAAVRDGSVAGRLAGLRAAWATLVESGRLGASDFHALAAIAMRAQLNVVLAAATAPREGKAAADIVGVVASAVDVALAAVGGAGGGSGGGDGDGDGDGTTSSGGGRLVDATLPFLLLEDAADGLLLADCEALWDLIDARREALAALVNEHQRYRLPLLRLATGLMRRLSRTQHTVFLGRLLVTLAYMFPLTDRSGVNMLGHFNADNVTVYDGADADGELLDAAARAPTSDAAPAPSPTASTLPPYLTAYSCVPRLRPVVDHLAAAASEVEMRVSSGEAGAALFRTFWRLQVYTANPSRAVGSAEAWALFVATLRLVLRAFEVADGLTAAPVAAPAAARAAPSGGSEEGALPAAASAKAGAAASVAASKPTGSTAPASAAAAAAATARSTPATAAPAATASTATAATALLPRSVPRLAAARGFVSPAGVATYGAGGWDSRAATGGVVAAGSSVSRGSSSGEGSIVARSSSGGSGGGGGSAVFGMKYLTNTRLLGLELQDAALRRHVLLQVLILLQYLLQQKVAGDAWAAAEAERKAATGPAAAAAAAAAAATGAARKPRETFAAGIDVVADLSALAAAANAALTRSAPDGAEFTRAVATLLSREAGWRAWKARNAPEFERRPPPPPSAAQPPVTGVTAGMKRRLGGSVGGGRAGKRSRLIPKRPLEWASEGLMNDLWGEAAAAGAAPRHVLEDYVAPVRTALDPDNGIEAEFYPTTNKLFVWRTYRLLAAERLPVMADASSTTLLNLLATTFSLRRRAVESAGKGEGGDGGGGEAGNGGDGGGGGGGGDGTVDVETMAAAAGAATAPQDDGDNADAAAASGAADGSGDADQGDGDVARGDEQEQQRRADDDTGVDTAAAEERDDREGGEDGGDTTAATGAGADDGGA